MKLKRTAKLQESGYNLTVNIPKEHREYLHFNKGDKVMITTDTKKKEIVIRKVEE